MLTYGDPIINPNLKSIERANAAPAGYGRGGGSVLGGWEKPGRGHSRINSGDGETETKRSDGEMNEDTRGNGLETTAATDAMPLPALTTAPSKLTAKAATRTSAGLWTTATRADDTNSADAESIDPVNGSVLQNPFGPLTQESWEINHR